jgi:hypothetical protein
MHLQSRITAIFKISLAQLDLIPVGDLAETENYPFFKKSTKSVPKKGCNSLK